MIEVKKEILKEIFKEKPRDAIKYDWGLLVVIGGSDFYSGSPALAAMAAFKTGVDMVRIIAPKRAADIIASFSPNLATYPLEGRWLTKKHLATLIELTETARISARENCAVVIGGGLGRTEETQEVILEYLKQVSVSAVIDADAIYALAKEPEIVSGKKFLITPHLYEFFVLTGIDVKNKKEEERIKAVEEATQKLKTTILLKGAVDIISDGKEVALNRTGSGYMTKGGCGDTLAGICGALMARGISPFLAAQVGAFINGKAGELAAEREKEGLLATDLIEAIPKVLH